MLPSCAVCKHRVNTALCLAGQSNIGGRCTALLALPAVELAWQTSWLLKHMIWCDACSLLCLLRHYKCKSHALACGDWPPHKLLCALLHHVVQTMLRARRWPFSNQRVWRRIYAYVCPMYTHVVRIYAYVGLRRPHEVDSDVVVASCHDGMLVMLGVLGTCLLSRLHQAYTMRSYVVVLFVCVTLRLEAFTMILHNLPN
jgi:hypothetical protein